MDVIEFLNYLLGREPTRQLGLQLAAVYDDASRRRPAHSDRVSVSDVRIRTKQKASFPPAADAIEFVDMALSFAVRREIFTVEEAMDLLRGVQNKLGHAPAVVIGTIVSSAEHSYRETPLVDRERVVDPLLDMRLALSACCV